jgi:hypothetical protein
MSPLNFVPIDRVHRAFESAKRVAPNMVPAITRVYTRACSTEFLDDNDVITIERVEARGVSHDGLKYRTSARVIALRH